MMALKRQGELYMIRALQPPDLAGVTEIWLNANISAHDFIPAQYWRDNFDRVKEQLLKAEIYVDEDEAARQIQGFIGLSGNYIAGIFVRGGAQSRGIGKRLLDFVKERREELTLHVYQKNTQAQKFYRREGFVIQSESVDKNTGENEYSMVWKR